MKYLQYRNLVIQIQEYNIIQRYQLEQDPFDLKELLIAGDYYVITDAKLLSCGLFETHQKQKPKDEKFRIHPCYAGGGNLRKHGGTDSVV